MKKYLGIFMVLAFVAGGAVASAQTATPTAGTTTQGTISREVADRISKIKTQMQALGVDLYRHEMTKRPAFGYAQMQNIQKRIDSKLEKMSAAGVNITAATTKVAGVQAAMEDTRIKLEALKQAVAESMTAPKENKPAFNTVISSLKKDAEDSVKLVRRLMADLLSEMRTYKAATKAK